MTSINSGVETPSVPPSRGAAPAPPFAASYIYSFEDFRALARARRLRKWPQPWRRFAMLAGIYLAAVVATLWWLGNLAGIGSWGTPDWLTMIGSVAGFGAIFLAFVALTDFLFERVVYRLVFRRYSQAGKRIDAEIKDDGIAWRGESVSGQIAWGAVKTITELADACVIWLGKVEGMTLPARAFTSRAEYEAAVQFVKGHLAKGGAHVS